MIEFSGELSNPCKLYFQGFLSRQGFIVVLTTMIVFSIPIIILSIVWDWIICLFLLIPITALIFVSIPKINAPMKLLNLYFPKKLTLESGIIYMESEKLVESRTIDKVKKVIDFGDWYRIVFFFPYKELYFICQKNLITKGTIKEFEALFQGKIIRKSK